MCSKDELPLPTEESAFEYLVARVLEIAPEKPKTDLLAQGTKIEAQVVCGRTHAVPVVAAA